MLGGGLLSWGWRLVGVNIQVIAVSKVVAGLLKDRKSVV